MSGVDRYGKAGRCIYGSCRRRAVRKLTFGRRWQGHMPSGRYCQFHAERVVEMYVVDADVTLTGNVRTEP